MRRAGSYPDFIEKVVGKKKKRKTVVMGISAPPDYVSEHEWGIKRLRAFYGMNDNLYGLERCIPTKWPKLYIKEGVVDGDKVMVVLGGTASERPYGFFGSEEPGLEKILTYNELGFFHEETITAAWDEQSFGFAVKGEENIASMKTLVEAYDNHEILIGLCKGGEGLCFTRIDAFSSKETEEFIAAEMSRELLKEVVAKSGIEQKLSDAGKRYFALSPRWIEGQERPRGTKYDYWFWLNPWDQKNDNWGWFTVEDIEAWAKGKGPVPHNA